MSDSKKERLQEYLKINKHRLDDEIIHQPSLFFEVAEAYTEASARRDSMKDKLAQVDAELDGHYRSTLEKPTENSVSMSVQRDDKHIRAAERYLTAKAEADQLAALKEAFHQRSYMLRELSSLFVTGYFERDSVEATGASKDVKTDSIKNSMSKNRESRRNRVKAET